MAYSLPLLKVIIICFIASPSHLLALANNIVYLAWVEAWPYFIVIIDALNALHFEPYQTRKVVATKKIR